ncbi:MAG TPA: hypothetical protein DDX33_02110 [Rikenellaceae bacterium]|nr:hypothetical protein [Rikenellaceae bacterium]
MRCRIIILVALLTFASCSTTRLVPRGERRLASNDIKIVGGEKISVSELQSSIRQQPNGSIFGWNPLISVYNWSNGSGRGINGVWEFFGTAPVVFDSTLVDKSSESMVEHLHYLGYYDAKVAGVVRTKKRVAKVTYVVDPGKRKAIDRIEYDIPPGEFAEDFSLDSLNMTVHPGDFLSEKLLESETVRGSAYFRNKGYYNFNKNHYFFEADTLSGQTVLHYKIKGYTRSDNPDNESPIVKYRIRNVDIMHPSDIYVRPGLLRDFNKIKPGTYYSEDVVNTTYYRFSALNMFGGVNIEMTPSDSAYVDCRIKLSGGDMVGYKVNLELSSNSSGLFGASPQLNYYHKNVFGGGEWLNLGFTGNWQFMPGTNVKSSEWGISAGISFPRALGYPLRKIKGRFIPRTEIKTSYNYQNRPEYRRTIGNVSFGYSGRVGENFYYQVYPVQFGLVKLYKLSDSFRETLMANPYLWDSYSDKFDLGLGSVLYYTTDASIVPKAPYGFVRYSVDLAGNVVSLFNKVLPSSDGHYTLLGLPYNQYVRSEIQLGRSFGLGKWNGVSLAMRFVAGVGKAYGNSSALPFEKQFYCGGASSMRGWQVRTLGPGFSAVDESFVIPSQTGDLKLELDAELRFKLLWKLEGAMFAEAGNIWRMDSLSGAFPRSIAADWGAGLRLNLDFILIRVDLGVKLHDPSQPEGQRWIGPSRWLKGVNNYTIHFGVGYPF